MMDILKIIINKITSRKFLATAMSAAVGAALSLGVDANTMQTVIGTVISSVSCVAYILTEGNIDIKKIEATIKNADEFAKSVSENVNLKINGGADGK